jgi:hypothetical protein
VTLKQLSSDLTKICVFAGEQAQVHFRISAGGLDRQFHLTALCQPQLQSSIAAVRQNRRVGVDGFEHRDLGNLKTLAERFKTFRLVADYLLASLFAFQNLDEERKKQLQDIFSEYDNRQQIPDDIKYLAMGFVFLTVVGENQFADVLSKAVQGVASLSGATTSSFPASPTSFLPPPPAAPQPPQAPLPQPGPAATPPTIGPKPPLPP